MHRRIAGRLTGRVSKWAVLVLWLLVVGGSATFASQLTEVQNNDVTSRLPASAESTRALEKLAPFQDPDAIPTIVVHEAEAGRLTNDQFQAVVDQKGELAELDGVQGEVFGPFPSEDRQATQTLVTFNFGPDGWKEMPTAAEQVRDVAELEGVSVHLTGAGGAAADAAEAFSGLDSTLLFATLGVVVLLLLLTYRSPVLWILPILSAVVALYTAEALVYLLAKYAGLIVNGQSQGILTVLVIGAGTDYALLLVARYREELRRHEDRHEAMAFALQRATPAILASAATVVLGMLCLFTRGPELHRRPRPGQRDRRRCHLPGDGHPAPRTTGDRRPVGVLAEATGVRLVRAHVVGLLGQGRPLDRPPRPEGLDRHRGGPRGGMPGTLRARRHRPFVGGAVHPDVRLHCRPGGARRARAR